MLSAFYAHPYSKRGLVISQTRVRDELGEVWALWRRHNEVLTSLGDAAYAAATLLRGRLEHESGARRLALDLEWLLSAVNLREALVDVIDFGAGERIHVDVASVVSQ